MANDIAAANTETPSIVDRFLDQTGGILQLKPNYVRRYYREGGRLLTRMQGSAANRTMASAANENDPGNGPWRPER